MMRWVVTYCLLLTLALIAGCQAFGIAAYALIPETIEAEYTPPQTPMLVMVENRRDPALLVPEAEALTAFIVDDLDAYEVAPQVDWRKLQTLRETDPDMPKRTISEIGRKMDAQQVLYVDLVEAYFGPEVGVALRGRVEARVRVIDVATGQKVYPMSSESRTVMLETPLSRDFRDNDPVAIRQELLRAAGTQIGTLFHEVAAVR